MLAVIATGVFAARAPGIQAKPSRDEAITALGYIKADAQAAFRASYGCVLNTRPNQLAFLITARSQRERAKDIVRARGASSFTTIRVIPKRFSEPRMRAYHKLVLAQLGNDDPDFVVGVATPEARTPGRCMTVEITLSNQAPAHTREAVAFVKERGGDRIRIREVQPNEVPPLDRRAEVRAR
jgi:hypothetical protein